jgi:hypothetical protein
MINTQTFKTPLEQFRFASERAEWLTVNSAWTRPEFDNLVQLILEIGDSDDLEPIFLIAPSEYVQDWFKGKIRYSKRIITG